jgi:hypothetical protein
MRILSNHPKKGNFVAILDKVYMDTIYAANVTAKVISCNGR